jgi:aspartate/tyrosine/aromatic aminotransferase
MFKDLETAPPDAILGLTEAFRDDPNPDKINLSVGVYKDENGKTPVLASVVEAERRLLEARASKSYLAIDGMREFGAQVRQLLFGADASLSSDERAVTLQTPGGTGSLRVAADFLGLVRPQARVWHSRPTWANHPGILRAAGRPFETYAYLAASGTELAFPAMLAGLQDIPCGDVVLLHACCHNPTGVDPTDEQWKQITDVVRVRQLLPLVDFAYQGFGDGLETDATGLRTLCRSGVELLICSSYSKNFGLYSERVGALTIVADSPQGARAALSHAKQAVRTNYSNPPQHGAAIVSTVLADAKLRSQWERELAGMRDRINSMRRLFVETMRQKAPQHDFEFIANQRGMFSFSGLNAMQVDQLRKEHSIYVVASGGRINVAGMTPENMQRLSSAIATVLE